jgi:hypothetical protein
MVAAATSTVGSAATAVCPRAAMAKHQNHEHGRSLHHNLLACECVARPEIGSQL